MSRVGTFCLDLPDGSKAKQRQQPGFFQLLLLLAAARALLFTGRFFKELPMGMSILWPNLVLARNAFFLPTSHQPICSQVTPNDPALFSFVIKQRYEKQFII